MKKIEACLFVIILLLTSCNTQKFYVKGIPGTIITTLDNEQLGVIDQSGSAEIKLDRKTGYQAFLQAKAPNSNMLVPFALDYKNKNRSSTNFGVGFVIFMPPLTTIAILGPGWIMLSRRGSYYDYDYLDNQTTNNDLIK